MMNGVSLVTREGARGRARVEGRARGGVCGLCLASMSGQSGSDLEEAHEGAAKLIPAAVWSHAAARPKVTCTGKVGPESDKRGQ